MIIISAYDSMAGKEATLARRDDNDDNDDYDGDYRPPGRYGRRH